VIQVACRLQSARRAARISPSMSSYLRVTEETDDARPATQPAHAAAWEAQRTQELSPASPPVQQPQQLQPALHFQGERNDQQIDSPPVVVAVDVAPTTARIPVSVLFPMHALVPGGTVGGPVSVAALRSDPAVLAAFSAAEHDRQTLLCLSYAAILVGVAFVGGVVGGISVWLGYVTRRSNLTLTDLLDSFLAPPADSGCSGRRRSLLVCPRALRRRSRASGRWHSWWGRHYLDVFVHCGGEPRGRDLKEDRSPDPATGARAGGEFGTRCTAA
jgi:hypothetical protein